MPQERELFQMNRVMLSYPKIAEMVFLAIGDWRVAQSFFRAYRHGLLVTRESSDGIQLLNYMNDSGRYYRHPKREGPKLKIVPRRLLFHGGYNTLSDMDLMARYLPVNIIDEANGKSFVPNEKTRTFGNSKTNDPRYRMPIWGLEPSFDLTKELEEILGRELIMSMWEQKIRYCHYDDELKDLARIESGIETQAERLERQRIRRLELKDIQGRSRTRIRSNDLPPPEEF